MTVHIYVLDTVTTIKGRWALNEENT